MKTYTVIYAEDVPHYACGEIEARNLTVAIKRAKADDQDSFSNYEPDWDHTTCKRIVRIEDEDGNILAEDIPLDDYHLRDGGDAGRRLCDAAAELLDAAEQAECPCTLRERNSGHKVGCWMPALSAAIANARDAPSEASATEGQS